MQRVLCCRYLGKGLVIFVRMDNTISKFIIKLRQHLLHLGNIWDWSSCPRSRFCSRKFCRKLRSTRPRSMYTVYIVYGVRDNGDTCSHQSTAVAVADLADEDVLAVALLVGQGAAAVALVTYFFRLFFTNIKRVLLSCLTRVLARHAASTDLTVLPRPHGDRALGRGHHGHRHLQVEVVLLQLI